MREAAVANIYTISETAKVAIGVAMLMHRETMRRYQAEALTRGEAGVAAKWQAEIEELNEGFKAMRMEWVQA